MPSPSEMADTTARLEDQATRVTEGRARHRAAKETPVPTPDVPEPEFRLDPHDYEIPDGAEGAGVSLDRRGPVALVSAYSHQGNHWASQTTQLTARQLRKLGTDAIAMAADMLSGADEAEDVTPSLTSAALRIVRDVRDGHLTLYVPRDRVAAAHASTLTTRWWHQNLVADREYSAGGLRLALGQEWLDWSRLGHGPFAGAQALRPTPQGIEAVETAGW